MKYGLDNQPGEKETERSVLISEVLGSLKMVLGKVLTITALHMNIIILAFLQDHVI